MRSSSVIDKRTELALGIVLLEHSISHMIVEEEDDAVKILDNALATLNVYWGIISCREK